MYALGGAFLGRLLPEKSKWARMITTTATSAVIATGDSSRSLISTMVKQAQETGTGSCTNAVFEL